MPPFVDFNLDDDGYENYVEKLAQNGVAVHPARRVTEEILRNGFTTEEVEGEIVYESLQHSFRHTKSGTKKTLAVEPFVHGTDAAESLLKAIESAFPQPATPVVRYPKGTRGSRIKSFLENYGCVIIIVMFIVFATFAVIGFVCTVRYLLVE